MFSHLDDSEQDKEILGVDDFSDAMALKVPDDMSWGFCLTKPSSFDSYKSFIDNSIYK